MPTVTELDPAFLAHIDACMDTSNAAAMATCLVGQREWMYPPTDSWSGDPQDIVGMNVAFDRSALNNQYVALLNDLTQASPVGSTMVTKLQIDYIAAMERAFRTRHYSSVRARIHAAGRRAGQAHSNGQFAGSMLVWLNRIMEASVDPN